MRRSLKQSVQDTPAGADEQFRYPKGSIVLCNACAVPFAKLDFGIALGDKAGRLGAAFKPLARADVVALAAREDIDAGVVAWARQQTPPLITSYLSKLREFQAGDPMICPLCDKCFVQVIAIDQDEVLDKAYTIELVTIPPEGTRSVAVRGKRLGYHHDWIHEEVVH